MSTSSTSMVIACIACFCLCPIGCKGPSTSTGNLPAEKPTGTRDRSRPISYATWDGRSSISLDIKRSEGVPEDWHVAIYWGYTRVESSGKNETLKGNLPNVGISVCKSIAFDAGDMQVSYEKGGMVRTKGALRSMFMVNAPVNAPERGGVIEVCFNAQMTNSEKWKVSSSFPGFAKESTKIWGHHTD